jgi:hypothetical protein
LGELGDLLEDDAALAIKASLVSALPQERLNGLVTNQILEQKKNKNNVTY